MATPRSFLLLDSTGAPLTTATPTYFAYANGLGVARTQPAFPVHLGEGEYKYLPTDADEAAGTVALISCGSPATPRYVCHAIHKSDNTNQFWAWHVEDGSGILWTGSAPTVGSYRDPGGGAPTPPSVVAVAGAYLYVATPSAADIAAVMSIRIDMPAGASVQYLYSDTLPIGPAPPAALPAPSSSVFVSTALARPLIDGGSDVLVFPGLDETFTLINDGRVLAEALARRLLTPRGTLPFHADYGFDLRNYVNESMTQDVLYRLKAAVERECELDERVLAASATVTYGYQTQALRVRVSVTTSNGPFKFVLNVTSLTAELLGEE